MSEHDGLICLKCARPTPPGANYCPECNAPLTAHAVNDPYDTILTAGYMYREASQRPKSPIVVAGIVMLLGPTFLGSAYALVAFGYEFYHQPRQFEWWAIFIFALFGGTFYISGSILLRTFENYQNRAAADAVKQNDEEEEAEEWWDEAEADRRRFESKDDDESPPETTDSEDSK